MTFAMQQPPFDLESCTRWKESELIEAAKAGDLEAFNRIVLMYQDLLFRIAYRIVADEDQANDAVQEAFLSAFQQIQSVCGSSMKSWLIRIAVNKCRDQLRLIYRRRAISLDRFFTPDVETSRDSVLEVPDTSPSVENCVEATELEYSIQNALSRLPVHFRSILILADIEGMSYEEISIIERIPIVTVKSRLARARLNVRGILLLQNGGLLEAY